MTAPSYSVLVAVDDHHWKEWMEVLPTWRRHRPEMLWRPLILVNGCEADHQWVGNASSLWPGGVYTFHWPNPGDVPQRDWMLEGIVRAVGSGRDYILKLDTDCVAMPAEKWHEESWFGTRPAIIASPWGYTKPADAIDRFDSWAERSGLPGQSLSIHPEPGASRVRHRRITGWCMWLRNSFAMEASWPVAEHGMPWPSQDGYHWALAKRLGEEIVTARMTHYGWRHCPHARARAQAITEAMA